MNIKVIARHPDGFDQVLQVIEQRVFWVETDPQLRIEVVVTPALAVSVLDTAKKLEPPK